jgi:hypothetical protein
VATVSRCNSMGRDGSSEGRGGAGRKPPSSSLRLLKLRYPESSGLKGKTVRCRRGPAAVFGDKSHNRHWPWKAGREGVASRKIRKPENLPDAFKAVDGLMSGERRIPGTKKDKVKQGAVLEIPIFWGFKDFFVLWPYRPDSGYLPSGRASFAQSARRGGLYARPKRMNLLHFGGRA